MPHDHRMRPLPDSYINAIRNLTDQIANPKKKMGSSINREEVQKNIEKNQNALRESEDPNQEFAPGARERLKDRAQGNIDRLTNTLNELDEND